MPPSPSDSTLDVSLLTAVENEPSSPAGVETEVLLLFDGCGPSLRRYVASFGLNSEETDDIVQDVFLSLFRHLRLGRSRRNLRGWLFQVAHNLALRQRRKLRNTRQTIDGSEGADVAAQHIDPSPNPEEQLARSQRERRLQSVLRALPERDRQCLSLRAQGCRYRDIAAALGISLGAVAKSLTRSLARLVHADER